VTPPAITNLVSEGGEFWRRYPLNLQDGFRPFAYLSDMHLKHLPDKYFPVVGSVHKHFKARNRRKEDVYVRAFEADTEQSVERNQWGLPVPNLEAAYISLAKYGKSTEPLTLHQYVAFDLAANWLERHFGPYMSRSKVKTLEEVIANLDMTTSPGYPWTRKFATKKELFEWDGVKAWLEEDWERLANDPDYTAIFGNSLKEEVRSMDKILANSIRTFTAGPVEMTVHGNRLFEDMNEKLYASHLRTASVVGFTNMYGGWNALIKKLLRFSKGHEFDISQYDSSHKAFMSWTLAHFRWKMLDDEFRTQEMLNRLLTYYSNLINTVIITSEGVFVRKLAGNPSGSVNTIADNTLLLYLLLAYTWIRVAPEGKRNYTAFDEELVLCLCGDDNTCSASEEALSFWTVENLTREFKLLGLTLTSEHIEPQPVENLGFLSAHTAFMYGMAIPIYDRGKLLTSLLYSERPDDPSYTLIRACALLRVGWADVELRHYMRNLISYLMDRFDPVLCTDPDWKLAKRQIPSEEHIQRLFFGEDLVPMTLQGAPRSVESCKSEIKIEAKKMTRKIAGTKITITNGKAKAHPQKKKGPKKSNKKRVVLQPVVKVQAPRPRPSQAIINPAPRRSKPNLSVRSHGDSCIFSGRDYIGTVSMSNTNVNGDVLMTFPINPMMWSGTRAAIESQLWEKYEIVDMTFTFTTTQSFTTAGQAIAFVDRDPKDQLTNSPQNMTIAVGASGNVRLNATKHGMVRVPKDKKFTDMFISPSSPDDRLTTAGILYVIYSGGFNLSAATVIWTVDVDYRFKFINRQLNPASSSFSQGARTEVVSAAPTNANLLNAASKIIQQFPVDIDGSGSFNIPTSITDNNNVLLTVEVGETNNWGARAAEFLQMNLTKGSILESGEVWSYVERETSKVLSNTFLLSAAQGVGIAGALVTVAKSLLPQNSNFLFSLVPKTVTSMKRVKMPGHLLNPLNVKKTDVLATGGETDGVSSSTMFKVYDPVNQPSLWTAPDAATTSVPGLLQQFAIANQTSGGQYSSSLEVSYITAGIPPVDGSGYPNKSLDCLRVKVPQSGFILFSGQVRRNATQAAAVPWDYNFKISEPGDGVGIQLPAFSQNPARNSSVDRNNMVSYDMPFEIMVWLSEAGEYNIYQIPPHSTAGWKNPQCDGLTCSIVFMPYASEVEGVKLMHVSEEIDNPTPGPNYEVNGVTSVRYVDITDPEAPQGFWGDGTYPNDSLMKRMATHGFGALNVNYVNSYFQSTTDCLLVDAPEKGWINMYITATADLNPWDAPLQLDCGPANNATLDPVYNDSYYDRGTLSINDYLGDIVPRCYSVNKWAIAEPGTYMILNSPGAAIPSGSTSAAEMQIFFVPDPSVTPSWIARRKVERERVRRGKVLGEKEFTIIEPRSYVPSENLNARRETSRWDVPLEQPPQRRPPKY
jgi:hypothetical protein